MCGIFVLALPITILGGNLSKEYDAWQKRQAEGAMDNVTAMLGLNDGSRGPGVVEDTVQSGGVVGSDTTLQGHSNAIVDHDAVEMQFSASAVRSGESTDAASSAGVVIDGMQPNTGQQKSSALFDSLAGSGLQHDPTSSAEVVLSPGVVTANRVQSRTSVEGDADVLGEYMCTKPCTACSISCDAPSFLQPAQCL